MRISELSRQTGVPVATIKFYLREGLLPPGRPTGRNQAQYSDAHRRRLRFIRALTHIGQLDLSSVRTLLDTIEDTDMSMRDLFQVVNRVLFKGDPVPDDASETRRADADVDAFIKRFGWEVGPDAPGHGRLVQVLAAMRSLGCQEAIDVFTPYAEAAERLAGIELDLLSMDGENTDRGAAVARAMLLDEALSAMRQLAQEHQVARRFRNDPSRPAPC
jgi:DNA-binding transcriptional MerR regulator